MFPVISTKFDSIIDQIKKTNHSKFHTISVKGINKESFKPIRKLWVWVWDFF